MSTKRFDLTGKTALVTGGSRGIGKGIALGMAEHGADVIIVYASASKEANEVVEAIKKMGKKAWALQQDLGKTEELAGLADKAWALNGKVDILVNNAGMAYLERFNEITLAHWRRIMAINIDAVFFLTQRIAELMIAGSVRGRIINVSSKNGFVGEAGLAHYNATKGAMELLTQSLAIELGEHGITVNTLAPGCIVTEIGGEFQLDIEQFLKYYYEHVPLDHRFGTIEECVGAAIFMAADAGSYMTGQHMVIDGGVICEQVPRMQCMPPYKNTLTGKSTGIVSGNTHWDPVNKKATPKS
jgi:NAD(P)-dependent dehydrogenase (short-subunit alcohol dehydrogenase family)